MLVRYSIMVSAAPAQLSDQLFNLLRSEVLVELTVHLDRRRRGARAETLEFDGGEQTVPHSDFFGPVVLFGHPVGDGDTKAPETSPIGYSIGRPIVEHFPQGRRLKSH